MSQLAVVVGLLLIGAAQFVGVTSWLQLERLAAQRIAERRSLLIGFVLTFSIAAAIPYTTLGRAIVDAEPEHGPRLQKRVWLSLLLTLVGVVVTFVGLSD